VPRRHLAVALLLSGRTAIEVDALRRATDDPDVERIPPHITLVPPVNVRAADLDGVLGTLRDAANGVSAFTLELGPTATFLPTSPTLFLTVGGDLGSLIRLRDALLVGPFDRPSTFAFVPHVTLRNPARPAALERSRDALDAYRATVAFDRVHLLEESDRIWRPIADAAFGRSRLTVGRGSLPVELAESERLDPSAAAFAAREWQLHDDATFGPATRWEREPFAFSARREDRVVGVATGWTGLGVGFLSELLVGAETRGEGIGSRLLASVEDLARRRGCRTLALRTDTGSPAAAFYAARGWRVEATFSEWLDGRDFVQLRREL
jgi:2'-5' RNA ligase/ribosomal protein S18 acetylase RimI-like enzyme